MFNKRCSLIKVLVKYIASGKIFSFTKFSLRLSIVQLQIAKIDPIFKKGERDKPTKYCSISFLTCFSKIFKGVIYKRVINFLNKHNEIINT